MEEKPLVSVIIPTYNRFEVKEAVESVLNQTYQSLEVIVVDDCSDTPALKHLEDIEDNRVRVLRHNVNRNASAARNTGIDSANGEYIAFLDDDDIWVEDKIESQLRKLNSTPEEFEACYTTPIHKLPDKEKKIEYAPEGDIRKEILLMEVDGSFGSSLIVKKSIVESVGGFDEDFPRHQDWEFLLRILGNTKICSVVDPKVVKQETYGPSTDVEKLIEAKKLYLNKFSDLIDSFGSITSRKIRSKHFYEIVLTAAQHKKTKKSLLYFYKATKEKPIRNPKEFVKIPYAYWKNNMWRP